jgi:hypothetical protein
LFVVRTWHESSSVVPSDEWRGSVEHVPSGQRLYFTHIDQMSRFIAQHSGWVSEADDERSVGLDSGTLDKDAGGADRQTE